MRTSSIIRAFLYARAIPIPPVVANGQQQRLPSPATRGTILKSMPTLPFLGSLFSSSASQNMSYPVEKSNDEWQAVLSKGNLAPHSPIHTKTTDRETTMQSSSGSSGRKGQRLPTRGNTTSTCRRRASTRAQPATRHCTSPTTSFGPAAAGRPSSMPSPAPSPGTPTARSAWPAPRSSAPTAAATWATSSRARDIRPRPTRGTASIASA